MTPSRKRRLLFRSVIGLGACLVFAGLAAFVELAWLRNFLLDQSAPGWVQAFGAIAALAVAVWLSNSANRQQSQQAKAAVLAFRTGLLTWLERQAAWYSFKNEQKLRENEVVLRDLLQVSASIRLDLLPPESMQAYLELRRLAGEAHHLATRAAGMEVHWHHAEDQVEKLHDAVTALTIDN